MFRSGGGGRRIDESGGSANRSHHAAGRAKMPVEAVHVVYSNAYSRILQVNLRPGEQSGIAVQPFFQQGPVGGVGPGQVAEKAGQLFVPDIDFFQCVAFL